MSSAVLQKRHIAALHLIISRIEEETKRVAGLSTAVIGSDENRSRFVGLPTASYLFSQTSGGTLNEFYRKNGQFEDPIASNNQLHRIVQRLRDAGLLFDPERPDHQRVLGNEHAYVPTPNGERFYRSFVHEYGEKPMYWPDSLQVSSGSIVEAQGTGLYSLPHGMAAAR